MADRTPFKAPLAQLVLALLWVLSVSLGLYLGVDKKFEQRMLSAVIPIVAVLMLCLYPLHGSIRRRVLAGCFVMLAIILSIVGLRGLQLAAEHWFGKPDLGDAFVLAPVAILVVAVGGALFYIRLRLRFVYGATEVLAGILVAATKVSGELKTLGDVTAGWTFALLTAGVYLVVRGLDNMHQGLIKEPLDGFVVWVSKYIPGTSRYEARSQLVNWAKQSELLTFGNFHGRISLALMASEGTEKLDYKGEQYFSRAGVHFLVVDDDGIAFRLAADVASIALVNIKRANLWEPAGSSSQTRWIFIPFSERAHWPHSFSNALSAFGAGAPAVQI